MTSALDRAKKSFEQLDTWTKGVHTPVNAGFTQQASATSDAALKHAAAASGTSAASENAAMEVLAGASSGIEASRAREEARKHGQGAAFHTANKKANTKTADAAVSAGSAASYSMAIAKEATKIQQAVGEAAASAASGVGTGAMGVLKGSRAAFRTATTAKKYHELKKIELPAKTGPEEMAGMRQELENATQALDQAYMALDTYMADEGEAALEHLATIVETVFEASTKIERIAEEIQRAERRNLLHAVHEFALKKQLRKGAKQTLTAGGELAKGAGGIVGIVSAATGGALMATPAGWALAAAGGGLILGVAFWKGLRAATNRYNAVRHPELHDKWDLGELEPGEPTPKKEASSRGQALKESLKFWKKAEKSEREAAAHVIYAFAAGDEIHGEHAIKDVELRRTAREMLIALKAGPADHKLKRGEWEESLNDPEKTAAWIKEITEALSSA
ncbi:hypothetical protein [Streptomyces spiralis]|nr:hypothetical protein [Streptomyces spiralis]